MRRYRLGRFAAVFAGGFVVAVIGSAVVSEEVGYLWLLTGGAEI